MKKNLSRIIMLLLMMAGANSAWGQKTTIYERGLDTDWSTQDLGDGAWSAGTIDNGLKQSGTNGSFESTLAISPAKTSKVSMTATINAGSASGRSGSYDYIKIGGVELRTNGQDKKASVVVDGEETALTGFTRGGDYTLNVTIDQATNNVSWEVSGSAEGSAENVSSSTKVSNIACGHYKAGRENYEVTVVLKSIKVEETKQTVNTVNYTVKYVCGENVLDTQILTGAVGSEPVISTPSSINKDNVKYFYVSDDASGKKIAADGSTVVTVTYREANVWSYTFKSNVGSWLNNGSAFEGDEVTVRVPRYVVDNDKAYILSGILKDKNNIDYARTLTLDENGKTLTINYELFAENIVYFSEGEDIISTRYTGGDVRESCGSAGLLSASNEITTLGSGVYKLYTATHCANSSVGATIDFNIEVPSLGNTTTIFTQTPKGYLDLEYEGKEFTCVAENNNLIVTHEGNNAGLDYILIQKTGEAKATCEVSSAGWATFCAPADFEVANTDEVYYAKAINDESVSLTALKAGAKVKAGEGVLIKTEGEHSFDLTTDATEIEGNRLVGVTSAKELTEGEAYILANQGGNAVFSLCTTGTIAAGKAYIPKTTEAGAPTLKFVIDDATAISLMKKAENKVQNTYNLAGQRVANGYKGIVIKHGKKILR